MTVQEGPDNSASGTYPYFSEELENRAGVGRFLTPYTQALEEIEIRAGNEELKAKVLEYLSNDLPECMQQDPVLDLARHVATPNFETLRFIHLLEPLDLDIVISQDSKDRFVPANMLKKSLAKMPICTRIQQSEGRFNEQYQNISIIDFASAQGKPFTEIETLWGEPLIDFHNSLFVSFTKSNVHIVDDAAWIDRNHRGNLLEHYKKFLALFLVHGILFEDYLVEDEEEEFFKTEILGPAFTFVEKTFGYRPLIVQLTPTSVESERFWLSYPKEALSILKERLSPNL